MIKVLSIRRGIYEVLVPLWPTRKGSTRWLNLVTRLFGIHPYGFLKQKSVGQYRLRLDPGDPNDLHYYFSRVGTGYSVLVSRLLKSGDCVIDVGANVGYFSAVCARQVGSTGRVHAIEASPMLAKRLREFTDEVKDGPIRIHHAAVWSTPGTVSFKVSANSGWSSLRENATFETAYQIDVPAITLDEFVRRERVEQVKLLKLDIEGAEIDALLGTSDLLRSGMLDYVLLEAEPNRLTAFGHTGEELAVLLQDHGYRAVCIIENDTIYPVTEDRAVPGSFNGDYLYAREPLYQSAVAAILR